MHANIQVLREGGENNLHSHRYLDGFWMVLKGRVRFYGPDKAVLGEFGSLQCAEQPAARAAVAGSADAPVTSLQPGGCVLDEPGPGQAVRVEAHHDVGVAQLRRRRAEAEHFRETFINPADIGGRFSVSIQSDGDMMYAPGVMWTAAKHKIPLLSVMHNNRGWHQEVMHVQRLSNFRNRVASLGGDMGPIGTSIQNPDIEYHKLAESMGWWAKGPIKDPAQLGPVLKEAVEVVKRGQPALVNVWTQPR